MGMGDWKMIISGCGKGGTGKTTVAVNLALAWSAERAVRLLDCDVEEPNAHLFLDPVWERETTVNLPIPVVDDEKCTACGRCGEVCAFSAITVLGGQVLVFPELCHGCGGCTRFCPTGAISEILQKIGTVSIGRADGLQLIQGRIKVGTPLAPPVIKAVRQEALSGADGEMDRHSQMPVEPVTIIDAPPGTSCPVIAAVRGTDYCILVAEPTPFGLNDLSLAVGMVRKLDVPFGVVVNKAGLGSGNLKEYCEAANIPILLEIPFDRRYAAWYSAGGRLIDKFPELQAGFHQLWRHIEAAAGEEARGGAVRQLQAWEAGKP